MASFVSLPIVKFSHATNLKYEDPIEWNHLQSPDMFVVFDDSSFSSQSSQGYFQGRRMKVIRGIDVLELLNIEELASRAVHWREEADRCGRDIEYSQWPFASVIRCPDVALWYHLPDGKIRRIQMRMSNETHFDSAVSVLQTLRCPLKVAASRQTKTVPSNLPSAPPTISHQNNPTLEHSRSHHYGWDDSNSRTDVGNVSRQAQQAVKYYQTNSQPPVAFIDPYTEASYTSNNAGNASLASRDNQEHRWPMTPPRSRDTHTSNQSPIRASNMGGLPSLTKTSTFHGDDRPLNGMVKLEHMVTEINPLRDLTYAIPSHSEFADYHLRQQTSGVCAAEERHCFPKVSHGRRVHSSLEVPPPELLPQMIPLLTHLQHPISSAHGISAGRPSSALPALERSPLPQPRMKLNSRNMNEEEKASDAKKTVDPTRRTSVGLYKCSASQGYTYNEEHLSELEGGKQMYDKRPATAPTRKSKPRDRKRKIQGMSPRAVHQDPLFNAEPKIDQKTRQNSSYHSLEPDLKFHESTAEKQTSTACSKRFLSQDVQGQHEPSEGKPQATLKKRRRASPPAPLPSVQAEIDKWKARDAAAAATTKTDLKYSSVDAPQPRKPLSELSRNVQAKIPLRGAEYLPRVTRSMKAQNGTNSRSEQGIHDTLPPRSICDQKNRSSTFSPNISRKDSVPSQSNQVETGLSAKKLEEPQTKHESSVPSTSNSLEPTITTTTRAIATALMFINPAKPMLDLTSHQTHNEAEQPTQSGPTEFREANVSEKTDTLSVSTNMLRNLETRSTLLPLQILLSHLPEGAAARQAALEELIFSVSSQPEFLSFCDELEKLWRNANIVGEDGKTVAPACSRDRHDDCAEEFETEEEL